jgi:hypothetical protein
MAEQSWHEARLIPTSGINGADEQERRATSALLAVLGAVREYGRALLKPLGAPAGKIKCSWTPNRMPREQTSRMPARSVPDRRDAGSPF